MALYISGTSSESGSASLCSTYCIATETSKIRAEWDEKKEFMLKNEPSISDLERMYSLKKSLEHIEENIRKNNLEINKVLLELKEGEE